MRIVTNTIEISAGFVSLPIDDWLRLVRQVHQAGMRAKPELGIQFGAGRDTPAAELAWEQTRDARWVVSHARRFLDAGVELIMIESEGLTENVEEWRTDVIAEIIDEVRLERLMFEAADPTVFAWYVKHYGADVNLFVDHSQIVQLAALRAGIWGPQSLWGRVVAYRD